MTDQRKIAIVGAGAVGITFAYTLQLSGLAREILLIDLDKKRLAGEVDDLNHGLFFVPPVEIRMGDYEDCRDARIIVIAAGAKQKPGETRLDLLKRNAGICRDIVRNITKYNSEAVFLVVTNPVDVLTYVALKSSGLPRNRVIGSGTVLDSARFRFLLSRQCGIDPRNVHAYVLGEHGDSEVAVWSMIHMSGVPLESVCQKCPNTLTKEKKERLTNAVRESAYHIIEAKGATYYAVSLAMQKIVEAILRDEKSILTVSSLMEGEYGMGEVCLSLPTVVGAGGAERVLSPPLAPKERDALLNSARVLKESIDQIDL